MQVHVDIHVMCMCSNFGGHGLSGFGDIATFKFGQISLSIIVYGGSEKIEFNKIGS